MYKMLLILLLIKLAISQKVEINEIHPIRIQKVNDSAVNEINFKKCKVIDIHSENVDRNDFWLKATSSMHHIVDTIEPYFKMAYVSGNISEECVAGWTMYFESLKTMEGWAFQMADSTGRLPSGLLSGTKLEFGLFDQCIEVETQSPSKMKGKYCMLCFEINFINNIDSIMDDGRSYIETYGQPPIWFEKIQRKYKFYMPNYFWCFGLCLPSTCSDQDVTSLFSKISTTWATRVVNNGCYVDEPKKWPLYTVAAMWSLLLLVGICILGTIIDMKSKPQKKSEDGKPMRGRGFLKEALICFSLTYNVEKLFRKRKYSSPTDCMDGLRFFLCLWIMVLHVMGWPDDFRDLKHSNLFNSYNIIKIARPISNGFASIEVFFFISGLFFCFSSYQTLKKSGKIDLMKFINQRYWRFLPNFVVFCLILLIMPVISSGPIWHAIWSKEIKRCQNYWWYNIFFMQNFLHLNDMCMSHSWFNAVLVQLSLAGLFFLYILLKSPKLGAIMGIAMVTACCYIDYYLCLTNKFNLQHEDKARDLKEVNDFASIIYFKPFHHFGSFMIGIVTCFLLYIYKDVKFSLKTEITGWIVSMCTFIGIIYFVELPIEDYRYIALYYALRNPIWGLAVAWCIFALLTGHGGIVNKFLSLEVFAPLGRMSFSFFVFHILIILFKDAARRERHAVGVIQIVYEYSSCLTFVIIAAAIGYVMVELPFNNLHDLLFKAPSSSQEEQIKENHVESSQIKRNEFKKE